MKYPIKNLEELDVFVDNFLDGLEQRETATIVSLSGDLGSGKTAFVKSAARYFKIPEDIASPTFVIQKEYLIEKHSFLQNMIHIDAYRLKNKNELEYLGWNEIISDPQNIIFIEWPEQVLGISMPGVLSMNIEILEGESRQIIVNKA